MSDHAQPFSPSAGPLRAIGQTALGMAAVTHALLQRSATRGPVVRDKPRGAGRDRSVIDAQVLPVTPAERKLEKVVAGISVSAADGDWHAVAREIRALEEHRHASFGLLRAYEPAALAARMAAATEADEPGDYPLLTRAAYAEETLDEIEAYFAEDPFNPILAALAARAHLDAGWTAAHAASGRNGRALKAQHLNRAAGILDQFDPLENLSPVLAEAHYMLALSAPDPAEALAAAYEDWSDLDPGSLSPHTTHAAHLLPAFHGSYARLEAGARAAADRTSDVFGAGAYAAFYVSALPRDERAIAHLDAERLVDGLLDLISYDDGDPETINQFTALLHAAGRPRRRGRSEPSAAVANRALLWTAAREFAAGMAGISAGAWGTETAAFDALAELYAPEIAEGARLQLARDGLHLI